MEVDFLADVLQNCWKGERPIDTVIASEVKMAGFGNVDFVIAEQTTDGKVGQFLSVELQAIDITGTVNPDYAALRLGGLTAIPKSYGLNWDNVYKRYITQLIRKGYFHHHWKSKIVAVIQDQVYQNIVSRANFMRTSDVHDPTVNIIFMTYVLEEQPNGQFKPTLKTVEGTSHSSLQQATLYIEAPLREDFCKRILLSVNRKGTKPKLRN